MDYIPFLKFKTNEIAAINELKDHTKEELYPFFDIARKENLTGQDLESTIGKCFAKYQKYLSKLDFFYLDNFDIDDRIQINSDDSYAFLIDTFASSYFIPVIGIDRSERHNELVNSKKADGTIQSDTVAIRIVVDNVLSYPLIDDEIEDLVSGCASNFKTMHLIIDNRVCFGIDVGSRSAQIINFLGKILEDYDFEEVIVTGSTITGSIKDLLNPSEEVTVERNELTIFHSVQDEFPDIVLGDYTAVSPNYSDIEFEGNLMRKVTAPRLIYSYDNLVHIKRGAALDNHPRGNLQYNDLSAILITEPFFRGAAYSFGDKYIDEKARTTTGKQVTPSTIPKALINLHIEFMMNDYF